MLLCCTTLDTSYWVGVVGTKGVYGEVVSVSYVLDKMPTKRKQREARARVGQGRGKEVQRVCEGLGHVQNKECGEMCVDLVYSVLGLVRLGF